MHVGGPSTTAGEFVDRQVEDVAVVGLPAEAGNESVVAAILPKEGQTVTLEQVREWAAKNLSNYALPRQIAILTEMPRSQIGKVLRRVVRDELLAAREAASGAATAGIVMGQFRCAR